MTITLKTKLSFALIAGATLTACESYAAGHTAGIVLETSTSMGTILTDTNGMSLYTFDSDSAGMSACNGGCAVNWPPLMVEDGAEASGKMSIITRADGSQQWAYDGAPLYFWKNDRAAGQVTGDGVGGVWHVAKP
ncbi:hypothetical protein [Aestuariibius sp. HNIBRBA575]|uniref:COG4315 family predicted lipoprotein n=1 Tax=Aestuariibius sp. HNIBRBA575 TaxID=3233343 RepID=UPI0034A16B20